MTFIYHEPLNDRYLNPLPVELHLLDSTCPEAKFIRLLSGTVDISHPIDDRVYKARTNYNKLPHSKNTKMSSKPIRECFDTYDVEKINNYLLDNNGHNRLYNESLLLESTHLITSKMRKDFLSSFVHLYRIIEFISYSFPLIHTSKSKNYFNSFDSLQKYFSNEGGELKFLNRFVSSIFENKPESDLEAEFNIPGFNDTMRSDLYRSIKRILDKKQSIIRYDDSLYQFHVKYIDLIDLIVFIRNRYFHFTTGSGMKNFKSSELIDPNLFFEIVIDNSFNWISRIYFEILMENITNN